MSRLPEGWVESEFGVVTKPVGGSTPPAHDPANFTDSGGVPWLTPADLSGYRGPYIGRGKRNLTPRGLAACSARVLPAGTVLFSSRAPVGYVAIAANDLATNQGFKSFPLPVGLDPRFVYYYLRHIRPIAEARATGTTFKELSGAAAARLPFLVVPTNEQKRIADKLDALLARVDACRERLDRVPGILKRFRGAVLQAATTGELTPDWRSLNPMAGGSAKAEVVERLKERKYKPKQPSDPDLSHWNAEVPASWSIESVSAFSECLDHLRVPVTKNRRSTAKGLYPYYGANGRVDMVDEYLFDEELVLVTEDETFYGREKPIAYRASGKCWVNNHAHVLLAGDKNRADYLCFALMFYNVIPWLTGTTGRAKLTQGVLNALPIAVPPHSELVEIVRRVESLFAIADAIEARYETARAHVERLTPALLAKAFRGELVPQDPSDEPAAELLKRLAAQPAGTPARPRRQRTAA